MKKSAAITEPEYVETDTYTTMSLNAARERRKEEVNTESFERRARILEALERTSQYLAIEVEVTGILEKIAETIGVAFGAKHVNFWGPSADKRGVSIIAAYGMQQQYIDHSRKNPMPLGEAWIGRAMKTGTTWSTSNIQEDPYLPKHWLPAVAKQGYHGLMCAPLIRKEEIVGGMCVYYESEHDFDYTEMSIGTIVANQAATAVENARIFGDLEAERLKTLSIIYSLTDGLVMLDEKGEITLLNPRAQELLYVGLEEVSGKTVDASLAAQSENLENLCNLINFVDTDYVTKVFETDIPQSLSLEVTQIPVQDQNKMNLGVMYLIHDVTRDKEIEKLKANFVSVASHQLRTPLSGMKWTLDTIIKGDFGDLSEKQQVHLGKVFNTNENMIKLVNDLLDTSRIEEGSFGYEFKKSNISKLITKIVDGLEPNALARNVSLVFDRPEGVPDPEVDPERFVLVLQNVIDNAVKYTLESGYVKVTLSWTDTELTIHVEDNGIGIPEKDQEFIFNKFFRAENAMGYQPDGSGLGLFIAKSVTEKHSGTIRFESEENEGTTFSITVPISRKGSSK